MISTDSTITEAQQKLQEIKIKLRYGADYYLCKEEAAKYISLLNEKGAAIAKQYGRKFAKFTFASLMR